MVPGARIELAWDCSRGILSPLRLPISPPGLNIRRILFLYFVVFAYLVTVMYKNTFLLLENLTPRLKSKYSNLYC